MNRAKNTRLSFDMQAAAKEKLAAQVPATKLWRTNLVQLD
jgi:hypothetical protein